MNSLIEKIPYGLYKNFSNYTIEIIKQENYKTSEIKMIERIHLAYDAEFYNCADLDGELAIFYTKDNIPNVNFYVFEDEQYEIQYNGPIELLPPNYKRMILKLFHC